MSHRVGQHLVVASMCVGLIEDAYDDWRWCYVDGVLLCCV